MSYAVHDSQPAQNWNGNMYKSNKRKSMAIGLHEKNESHDLRSNTLAARKVVTTRGVVNKRNGTVGRGGDSSVSGLPNQFLIDGKPPIQPNPSLLAKKTETRHGPGRHRSVDLKGLIMELIDEVYPPTVCPTCLDTASGRSEADLHFKTEHHGVKAFRCVHAQCEQAYSSKPGLRYHLEHAHRVTLVTDSSESPRRSERYNTASKLASKSSLSTSINNRNYETNSKRFKKQELSSELQKKLEEAYDVTVCPACKEQFKRKTHVIRHLVEAHHGQEPYKCVVADCKRTKAYATREGLVYHLVSYHDEMHQ